MEPTQDTQALFDAFLQESVLAKQAIEEERQSAAVAGITESTPPPPTTATSPESDANATHSSLPFPSQTVDEALALLTRALPYKKNSTTSTDNAVVVSYRRIPIESLPRPDQLHIQAVLTKYVPSLEILEANRDLTGTSNIGGTEGQKHDAIVLNMEDVSTVSGETGEQEESKDTNIANVLLVPEDLWSWMTQRIRTVRGQWHNARSARREAELDRILVELWGFKKSEQQQQQQQSLATETKPKSADKLLVFMFKYGASKEPPVQSILKGLINLIQQQIGQSRVLTWTIDRAHMTEQGPGIMESFLGVLHSLGIFYAVPENVSAASTTTTATEGTLPASQQQGAEETDLVWTFGPRMDDRILLSWIRTLSESRDNPLPASTKALYLNSRSKGRGAGSSVNAAGSIQAVSEKSERPIMLFAAKATTVTTTATATTTTTTAALSPTAGGMALWTAHSREAVLVSTAAPLTTYTGLMGLVRWIVSCGGHLDSLWARLFTTRR